MKGASPGTPALLLLCADDSLLAERPEMSDSPAKVPRNVHVRVTVLLRAGQLTSDNVVQFSGFLDTFPMGQESF